MKTEDVINILNKMALPDPYEVQIQLYNQKRYGYICALLYAKKITPNQFKELALYIIDNDEPR